MKVRKQCARRIKGHSRRRSLWVVLTSIGLGVAIVSAPIAVLLSPAFHRAIHLRDVSEADYTYGQGYVEAGANGGVYAFGNAGFWGSIQSVNSGQTAQSWLGTPIIGVAEVPGGGGYWLAGDNGEVCGFGSATVWSYDGGPANNWCAPDQNPSTVGTIVGIAADPNGQGYWLVNSAGDVYTSTTSGAVPYYGNAGSITGSAVGIASTPTGDGYWITTTVGAVYTQGNAGYEGGMNGQQLNKPIVGIASGPNDDAYWLVGGDGGTFNFGGIPQYGSLAGKSLYYGIVGIASSADEQGFYLMAYDGGLFTYGDAQFQNDVYGDTTFGQIAGVAIT